MRDLHNADPDWRCILLRYFNPVGAHPSGRIGEDPRGVPNNLMPFVQQVAVGRRKELTLSGSDYNTKDGTGVGDMIPVKSELHFPFEPGLCDLYISHPFTGIMYIFFRVIV